MTGWEGVQVVAQLDQLANLLRPLQQPVSPSDPILRPDSPAPGTPPEPAAAPAASSAKRSTAFGRNRGTRLSAADIGTVITHLL